MPVQLKPPVGIPTPLTLADSRDWNGLVENQLATVRKSAENWRNGLVAMIGLITVFLAIRKPGDVDALATAVRDVVGFLLLLGLASATIGAVVSLNAAYGSPSIIDREEFQRAGGLTGTRLRLARTAVGQLRLAKFFTLLTLVLVTAAVGLTWYGQRETTVLVDIERTAEPNVCGTLIASQDGYIDIAPETAAAVRVPATALVSLRLVDSCP